LGNSEHRAASIGDVSYRVVRKTSEDDMQSAAAVVKSTNRFRNGQIVRVVVSTTVSQSGSTISGDVSRIIVVTPNPGYEPDLGHLGTGTVVATFCTTGGRN